MRALTEADAIPLQRMKDDPHVYRTLPSFLFEQRYADAGEVIRRLYSECRKESIILGVFSNGEFCGLAELYGYRETIHIISVGCRLAENWWGKGITTEVIRLLAEYLYGETDCEIIAASTLIENRGAAKVLKKTGSILSLMPHRRIGVIRSHYLQINGYDELYESKESMCHMRIYIAAPLFNEAERFFNENIDALVCECGHDTFLPQREGGCVADLPDTINGMPKRQYLFQLDCEHMEWCDAVLFLLDGRVPDEGACFELGYCYAKGKRCIGYKTDARSFIDGFNNVMLDGALEAVLHTPEELRAYLTK